VESGARNVDHILRGVVLPLVSGEILRRMAEEQPLTALQLSLDASGDIVIAGGPA
jgi:type VI secretion system protein VasG